jgi:hypothetical protein
MTRSRAGGLGNLTADPVWTPEELELLRSWGRRASAAQHAHYVLSARLGRQNLLLGIPVIIFATIVGTSLFATLSQTKSSIPVGLRIGVATISLVAAILSAIQTFLRFAERSERHAQAADWYSAIHREIEEIQALPDDKRDDPHEVLDRLRKELNKLGQTYPAIGEKTWHQVAPLYGVTEPSLAKEMGTQHPGRAGS